MITLTGWHGSHNWSGPPEIRPPRKGRYEYGCGIFITNICERARQYAKGGGTLLRMTIILKEPPIAHTVSLEELINFVQDCPGLRHRKNIIADLNDAAELSSRRILSAENLNNLIVNNEALTASSAPHVAKWLSDHGMPVSYNKIWAMEEWMVVFNPAVITNVEAIRTKEIDWPNRDYPIFSEQVKPKSHLSMQVSG
jgi:hypothetical protein